MTRAPTFLQNSHEVVQSLTLHREQVLHVEPLVLGPADGQVAPVTIVEQVNHLNHQTRSVSTEVIKYSRH